MLPVDADTGVELCRLFSSLPGPLQSVQRAEIWGVLQSSKPVHLGVDNLNVVRHVGRIMAGKEPDRPFELLTDGDLLLLVQTLVARGALAPVPSLKLKVMLMMTWFAEVGFACLTRLVMTGLMRLLTSVDVERLRLSRTLGGILCRLVVIGILLFVTYIDFCIAIARAAVNDDGLGGIATPLHSTPLHSTPLHSTPLHSTPLHSTTTTTLLYSSTILPFYHATILPFYHSTILPFYHSTILPFYHSTILPFYHSTILPFSTLLFSSLLCSALRYSALRYSALRYSALRYSALRYSALRYSALRYSALLCSTLLYSTLLYSTLLYSTLLYSTLLYSTTD